MATHAVGIPDPFIPPTYIPLHTVVCGDCHAELDADEYDLYDAVDGRPFCKDGGCLARAHAAAFRRESASDLIRHLEAAESDLLLDERTYPCELDDPGHPLTIIEDVKRRAQLFAEGKDNGYRHDGLMLDHAEMVALRRTLELAARALPTGELRANLQAQLDALNHIEARTEEGAIAA